MKPASREELRARAAAALDATHWAHERGPRTMNARARVAFALDRNLRPKAEDVRWLEMVAIVGPPDAEDPAPPPSTPDIPDADACQKCLAEGYRNPGEFTVDPMGVVCGMCAIDLKEDPLALRQKAEDQDRAALAMEAEDGGKYGWSYFDRLAGKYLKITAADLARIGRQMRVVFARSTQVPPERGR